MTRILIVDDDRQIADLIEVYLKNDGYIIDKAGDGMEALKKLEQDPPDLIVLDIMMPKMDGLEFCKYVRKNNQVPILMVSAKAEDMDKIMGLMTGADDYMIKPFNPLELAARVKALLRRANYKTTGKADDVLYIGSVAIDKRSHGVTAEGSEIKLTAREFEILYLLAKNRGRVYASEEIFEKVWNEPGEGSNKTVMVHISNIREKLEAALPGESVIQTVWGVGYKIEK
ncbi:MULTISPECIES: response regulator transcription factor [Cytobacillus]|jgi:DNA-binding response OmpR family regulator|uniref:DNA-binding response regulator n=2 Tax=Cytobacillus TaxID=2675230 RepID=A0ABX3CSV4_9BACI|nr:MULTISPECIES: response regulator transcription factor [Cytobacillus]EFV75133.1 DNA-binding response regulator [Bacillus sp. 2_A_57_CT2]MBY0156712.1 response regulator transcription factor [Cytobacillus firmus]MBU8731169.1 response regulator transcription factor [Cytobacillus oceanisediminis]MCM3245157.1 response regulator transcription factor [Cytobacillus oceanisediminis]MCM3391404.1 response regulator transcription factor [Cytobacillus oceanisediminis]